MLCKFELNGSGSQVSFAFWDVNKRNQQLLAASWRMNRHGTWTINKVCCLLDIWSQDFLFFFLCLCSDSRPPTHLTNEQSEYSHMAFSDEVWFAWMFFLCEKKLNHGKNTTSLPAHPLIWTRAKEVYVWKGLRRVLHYGFFVALMLLG